jgi:hypothetical protein
MGKLSAELDAAPNPGYLHILPDVPLDGFGGSEGTIRARP